MKAQRILARRRWHRRIRDIECAGWDHLYRLEGYDGLGNVRPWWIDYTPPPKSHTGDGEEERGDLAIYRTCEILVRCVRLWRGCGQRIYLTDEWATVAYPVIDEKVLSWIPFVELDGYRHQEAIHALGFAIRPAEPVGIPRIVQAHR